MAKAQPYKCFGDFLYDTRIKIGLTREAATEKINEQSNSGKQIISDYSLGRYERGEALPKADKAVAIARAYGNLGEVFEKLSECIQFSETKKDRRWRSNAKSGHVKKLYQHYTTKGVI